MKTLSKLLTILAAAISFSSSSAQITAPEIEWQNTIGGSGLDMLYSIQQTIDGGYILGGNSLSNSSGDKTEDSHGENDYWLVKLNSAGEIEWQNTIGGSYSDDLYSIQQTSDKGYILGGYSKSEISGDKSEVSQGESDYWVVKVDSTGIIGWQNTIGGSGWDDLYSIQQTTDGGYILGGYSNSDISGDKSENSQGGIDYWVVKLSNTGEILWQNTIGGNDTDLLFSIQQTEDGGYILGGSSDSYISGDKSEDPLGGYESDYWVVKLNDSGTIEWQNTIGGNDSDELYSIQQTSDGGYILGGFSLSDSSYDKSEPSKGFPDYWVVKLNGSGTIVWQNTIGGFNSNILVSIQQTADSGYILGGYSNSSISGDKSEDSQGSSDYWVVKLNNTGDIVWQNTIGGAGDDNLQSIQQTSDGGYILGGNSLSGISGDKSEASQGSRDYWVVKLKPENETGIVSGINNASPFSFFPNPTNGIFNVVCTGLEQQTLSIKVFDLLGREAYALDEKIVSSTFTRQLDLSNFSSGIYLLQVIHSGQLTVKKLVIKK